MKPVWRRLVIGLLVASLGANVWLSLEHTRNVARVRGGAANLGWGANYALNGIVRMVEDPKADWNSPGFRISLVEIFEWATLYSQVASSNVGGRTTGAYDQVVTELNYLGSSMSDYRSHVRAMAVSPGPVSEEHRAKLKRLAAILRTAGWPRDQVHRDDEQGWAEFAGALGRIRELEGTVP